MKTTLTILKPGAEPVVEEIDLPDAAPGLKALKGLILPHLDGGYLERVLVLLPDGTNYADMFVDEMGHLTNLPRNEIATEHYRRNWLKQHPKVLPETMPDIVGPAVLFSRRVWF